MGSLRWKRFSEEEKVKILLQEYATLRSELLTRTNNVYQLITISAGLFVWILGRSPSSVLFWLALVAVLAPFSYFYWLLSCDIAKAAKRVRELENDINRRAGETLLVWETSWGRQVTGYWGKKTLSPNKMQCQNEVE